MPLQNFLNCVKETHTPPVAIEALQLRISDLTIFDRQNKEVVVRLKKDEHLPDINLELSGPIYEWWQEIDLHEQNTWNTTWDNTFRLAPAPLRTYHTTQRYFIKQKFKLKALNLKRQKKLSQSSSLWLKERTVFRRNRYYSLRLKVHRH